MSAEEFGGIARALVSAAGGYAVGAGMIDQSTATTIGGALVTILVAVWSIYAKRKAA